MVLPILAHHMAITILGKEYEPHGVAEHAVVFAVAAVFLGLAIIGAVTAYGWIVKRLRQPAPSGA